MFLLGMLLAALLGVSLQQISEEPINADEFCRHQPDGSYRDPSDCSRFISCYNHIGVNLHCPSGLVFSQATFNCQSPINTPECAHYLPINAEEPINADEFCRHQPDGSYRDPSNCSRFIACYNHIGVALHCPTSMVFNQAFGNCQFPYNTPECAHFLGSRGL